MTYTYVLRVKFYIKNYITPGFFIGTKSRQIYNVMRDFGFINKYKDLFHYEYELHEWTADPIEVVIEKYKKTEDPRYLRWENYDSSFPKIDENGSGWYRVENEDFLNDYESLSIKEMMNKYSRTEAAIRSHANNIRNPEHDKKKIMKETNSCQRWSKRSDDLILEMQKEGSSLFEIADRVGRTTSAVEQRLRKLNPKENDDNEEMKKLKQEKKEKVKELNQISKKINEIKPARKPSEYNEFIAKELPKIRNEHPEMTQKECFSEAAKRWSQNKQ